MAEARAAPPRFGSVSAAGFAIAIAAVAFVVVSFKDTGASLTDVWRGLPQMGRIVGEMFPPSADRLLPVGKALLETFQMAVAGTALGVVLSVPLAVLATRHLSHPALYAASRTLIALFRVVPDLVWALFFVATVGLGPFAGTLAIMIDKIGFCGRFFAEAMEEADRGPQEALRAAGASGASVVGAAVVPGALPSMVNTALFGLEKATRSSVVLGLVGAGGIGIELQVSMDMFRYSEAATIILAIFVLVLAVERVSTALRRRVL